MMYTWMFYSLSSHTFSLQDLIMRERIKISLKSIEIKIYYKMQGVWKNYMLIIFYHRHHLSPFATYFGFLPFFLLSLGLFTRYCWWILLNRDKKTSSSLILVNTFDFAVLVQSAVSKIIESMIFYYNNIISYLLFLGVIFLAWGTNLLYSAKSMILDKLKKINLDVETYILVYIWSYTFGILLAIICKNIVIMDTLIERWNYFEISNFLTTKI